MRWLVIVAVLALAGCSALPAEPAPGDYSEIVQERRDAVWAQSKLPDSLRPAVPAAAALPQYTAAHSFSACMLERGWTSYSATPFGYSYQDISLATSESERLDWYECFAAYPVDSTYTLQSVAQFDFLYDYYQDTLIPCLQENGFPITDAPTRLEFRTTWVGWSDPLFPFLWNPYYRLQQNGAVDTTALEASCPPQPPNQDFYVFES